MQRQRRTKNYYEDLTPQELANKMAQILWYAQPDVNREWKSVGNSEKAVYRRLAQIMIQESKFRISSTRDQISRERYERREAEKESGTTSANKSDDVDEEKILGIRKR